VKDTTQAMNILEADDLYQSYNQAARECQCSPNTVRSLVAARRPWP
jgi:DNA-directed RNA polymerase specialized sigma24 family protein